MLAMNRPPVTEATISLDEAFNASDFTYNQGEIPGSLVGRVMIGDQPLLVKLEGKTFGTNSDFGPDGYECRNTFVIALQHASFDIPIQYRTVHGPMLHGNASPLGAHNNARNEASVIKQIEHQTWLPRVRASFPYSSEAQDSRIYEFRHVVTGLSGFRLDDTFEAIWATDLLTKDEKEVLQIDLAAQALQWISIFNSLGYRHGHPHAGNFQVDENGVVTAFDYSEAKTYGQLAGRTPEQQQADRQSDAALFVLGMNAFAGRTAKLLGLPLDVYHEFATYGLSQPVNAAQLQLLKQQLNYVRQQYDSALALPGETPQQTSDRVATHCKKQLRYVMLDRTLRNIDIKLPSDYSDRIAVLDTVLSTIDTVIASAPTVLDPTLAR